MKTKITVYLQGTSMEYIIELDLKKVILLWELNDNLIIPGKTEYIYINKKECPIVEFREVE